MEIFSPERPSVRLGTVPVSAPESFLLSEVMMLVAAAVWRNRRRSIRYSADTQSRQTELWLQPVFGAAVAAALQFALVKIWSCETSLLAHQSARIPGGLIMGKFLLGVIVTLLILILGGLGYAM